MEPQDLPRLARRLREVPPTIFTTMSSLAMSTGALNLGQGYPDKDGPSGIVEAAVEALRSGHNQYAPGPGVPALREAIARHQQRHYGVDLDPETQVLVTAGATEAIAACMLALVDPGDEVVLIEPYYDAYAATVEMTGGVRRSVALRQQGGDDGDGFRLDVEGLRAAITDRTVALVVNTPHNPTGTVLTTDELDAIAGLASSHDLLVITDDVYEHLTFDGHRHVPLCSRPGMADRTLTISSAGKSFSVTGWKVGWVTGAAELVSTVMRAKQWLTFTNAAPLQPAVAHALDHESAYVEELAETLAANRDLLATGLRDLGLAPRASYGGYFLLGDISHLGWPDAMAFCHALPDRAGVVAIPAQAFYDSDAGDQLVRWAFCKDTSTLEQALERLGAADLTA